MIPGYEIVSGQPLWLTCCWCLELTSSWLPRMLLSPFPGNRWAAWKNWKSTSPQWELSRCVTQWCFSCSVFSKHRPSEFRESDANTSKSGLPWGPWEYASDPPTTDSWVLQRLWNPLLCLCSGCFPRVLLPRSDHDAGDAKELGASLMGNFISRTHWCPGQILFWFNGRSSTKPLYSLLFLSPSLSQTLIMFEWPLGFSQLLPHSARLASSQ